jgi:hypothetical protein
MWMATERGLLFGSVLPRAMRAFLAGQVKFNNP